MKKYILGALALAMAWLVTAPAEAGVGVRIGVNDDYYYGPGAHRYYGRYYSRPFPRYSYSKKYYHRPYVYRPYVYRDRDYFYYNGRYYALR